MHPFANILKVNWMAVVAATVVGFFLGFLWYALLFGSTWQGLTGITEEIAAASNMTLAFGISILATFFAAWGIAVLIGRSPSAAGGMMTGLFAGLFFVATMFAQNYVYGLKPLALWFVDAGYAVVLFAAMGAVIGMMKKPM